CYSSACGDTDVYAERGNPTQIVLRGQRTRFLIDDRRGYVLNLDVFITQRRLHVDRVFIDSREADIIDEADSRPNEFGHERSPRILLDPGTGEVSCGRKRDRTFAGKHDRHTQRSEERRVGKE